MSPAQTADARLLMECNTTCTDFVCVAIKQHRRLFPSTSDEKPPKRLRLEQMGQMALIHLIFDILCLCSIVLSVDDLPDCWGDGGHLVQRSLYNPQENSPKHSTSRSRRGSAPYLIASPQEEKQTKSGMAVILCYI